MPLTNNQQTELDIIDAWINHARSTDDPDLLQYHLKQKVALLERIKGNNPAPVIELTTNKSIKERKTLTKDVIQSVALEFSQMSLQDILRHNNKTLLLSIANLLCWIVDNPGCTNNDIYGALGLSYTRCNEYILYLTRGGFPIKRIMKKLPKRGIYGAHNGFTYYVDAAQIAWYEDYTRFVNATK